MAAVNDVRVGLTFYDIWNLEFFNSLIPNSCLYEGLSTLNIIALQYVSAFYPLLLIGLAYTCIELHGRNGKPIVWLWKPFHKCKVKLNKIWELQWSVVHAFATFLLLSCIHQGCRHFIFSTASLQIVQCIRGTSGANNMVL